MKGERMLVGVLLFLVGFLAGISWQPSHVSAQATLESSRPEWVIQTRIYAANRKATWDAYLYNVRTGETYFINQATKTLVEKGTARGADK